MKNILITGGSGFIGNHIIDGLKNKFNIFLIKNNHSKSFNFDKCLSNIVVYESDKESIDKAFRDNNIDIVIHLATNYGRSCDQISDIIETNILFASNVLDGAIKYGASLFINTDTFYNSKKIKMSYLEEYILSKKQFFDWLSLKAKKIKVINMKLHHVYGKGDRKGKFIVEILDQLKNNAEEINLSRCEQQRDFIHISDVVNAYIKVIEMQNLISTLTDIEVGTGMVTKLKFFVEELNKKYSIINNKKLCKLNFGAVNYRDGEPMKIESNNMYLKSLGWRPLIDLNSGINLLLK